MCNDDSDDLLFFFISVISKTQDSRFVFVTYTIIQIITAGKCKSGPLNGQCNYMELKHKRIYIKVHKKL